MKILQSKMFDMILGMDNTFIVNAVRAVYPEIYNCDVKKRDCYKTERYTNINVSVTTPQAEIKLIERIYAPFCSELYNYNLINESAVHILYAAYIPRIFYIDIKKGILLIEDLSDDCVQGNHFNDNGEDGEFIRENINALLLAAAKFQRYGTLL